VQNPGPRMAAATPPPLVSVVVPVYRDHDRLARCLEALARQSYPAERREIVVVDNAPDPCRRPAVLPASAPVRLVHEPRAGSYAARNRGIALARGDILAFTDADCIPEPDWMRAGVDRLAGDPRGGVAAGAVELFYARPERPNVCELYDALAAFRQETYVTRLGFGATANLFASRAVLEVVGGFDPRLKSQGDVEWGRRVAAAGYTMVYASEARVRHPARATLGALAARARRLVGGMYDLEYARRGWLAQARREVGGYARARRAIRDRGSTWPRRRRAGVHAIAVLIYALRALEVARLHLGGTSSRG
jgi:GT2 family glycosyltransferase